MTENKFLYSNGVEGHYYNHESEFITEAKNYRQIVDAQNEETPDEADPEEPLNPELNWRPNGITFRGFNFDFLSKCTNYKDKQYIGIVLIDSTTLDFEYQL